MDQKQIGAWIEAGEAVFGLELGSTRIKAVLIGENGAPLASGSFDWENRLENGVWTYRLEDVWHGIQESYKNLASAVREKYGVELKRLKSLGFSAMMHGYLAFDRDGALLVPFRTWRNTMTEAAAEDLTRRFGFNIPQRWSIAHLHQAILNGEPHVKDIAFITTLAGYVHWKLTGERVLGVGDASGMFPIDSETNTYDAGMLEKFDVLHADKGYPWTLGAILPAVRTAGEGGPWGMALLAAYRVNGAGMTLEDYLDSRIFAGSEAVRAEPDAADTAGFEAFLARYNRLLPAERAAVDGLR